MRWPNRWDSTLGGKVRRVIVIHEREEIEEDAFKALIGEAIAFNSGAVKV